MQAIKLFLQVYAAKQCLSRSTCDRVREMIKLPETFMFTTPDGVVEKELFAAETLQALESYLDENQECAKQLLDSPVAPMLLTSSQTEHFDANLGLNSPTSKDTAFDMSLDVGIKQDLEYTHSAENPINVQLDTELPTPPS